MVFSLEDCGFRRRSQVRWIPEARVKPASQSIRTWMEMPSRITSPASYLCVLPARTNEYIWAMCALSNVVNDIVHACDRLLRWYSVPTFLAPAASVLVGILAKGLFLLRSFECEATAEPGSFDAIAEVEVYACIVFVPIFTNSLSSARPKRLTVTWPALWDVTSCVCRVCVSERGGRGRGLLEDRL